jgi:lysophospholipase L1-like esterase
MMKFLRRSILIGYLASLCTFLQGTCSAQAVTPILKFDFGSGPVKAGYTRVGPAAVYQDEVGYGYEPGAKVALGENGETTTSELPFTFSAKVPEGNYEVKITFGGSSTATTLTVKAESGRLMLERLNVKARQVIERSFTTNVRTPKLAKLPMNATGREDVSLDQFDRGNARDWDDKLNIEIDSPHAALRTIEISASPFAPTVFLAGDSTVTDRDGGGDVSWGQLLPRFFRPGVAVSNQAQSGETLKSFANALRLDKILSQMKEGDYLFIQFGHNDSKQNWPQTYVAPETTYKDYLKAYIAEAKLRGAIPILVTPMDRADRTTGLPMHGHGGYPDAMREVSKEEHVPLIDLYKMSILLYDSAGGDAPKILADGTHSTAYGGYEFAKCIIMGIKENKLGLADYIVPDFEDFSPAHPDTAAQLGLEHLFDSKEKTTIDGGRNEKSPLTRDINGRPADKPRIEHPGAGPL